MNREIEFRMWNCVKDNPNASKYFYDVNTVMECLKQQMLFNNGNKLFGYDHIGDGCAFEQYTGLKDRNGVKIFMGDKLKSPNAIVNIVVFENSTWGVKDRLGKIGGLNPFSNMNLLYWEVCGNIHTP